MSDISVPLDTVETCLQDDNNYSVTGEIEDLVEGDEKVMPFKIA